MIKLYTTSSEEYIFNTVFSQIHDKETKKGLFYSIIDGILWAIMYGLAENYVVPFAIVFGATSFHSSIISGANQLGIGVGQLAGAKFVNYFPKYRKILTIISNIIHAISWLLMFFLTVFTKNIYFLIIIYFISLFSTNFGIPSWLSWMNELMPNKIRGAYWGLRNRIMGIFQFVGIVFGGISLYFFKKNNLEIAAFGLIFILAFLFRGFSFIPLGKQHEPKMKVPDKKNLFKFKVFLTKLATTNFGKFSLFCFFMTFSVNLLAPLIPVYIIKTLNFNYIQYMTVIMLSLIFSFVFMTYWGPLSDKYGNYRIIFITSIALPLLTLGWAFLKNFYLISLLQILSGFVWAGFNLSMINFIFDAVRKENISKIMAYFNALNNFFAFAGSILGGILAITIDKFFHFKFFFNSFIIIALLSMILRIITIIFFINKFKEVREVEKSPSLAFFYAFKPFTDFVNRFQVINYNIKKKTKII